MTDVTIPDTPLTREEQYLNAIYNKVGGGGGGGSATLIHKTGYGQETAVSTTDGGATWA